MITTEIDQIDPATRVYLQIRSDLRAQVESAASLLEAEFADLDAVAVNAHWRFVDYPQVGLRIRLDLSFSLGALSIQFLPDEFENLNKLQRRLRQAASDLSFQILKENRKTLREQLDRLAATSVVGAE